MKRLRRAALTALLAWASGTLAAASEPPTLRLATAAFPPFRVEQAQGALGGADVEIVRAVFQRLGVRLQIDLLPPRRAMSEGAEGRRYAGFFTFTRTPEREKTFFFSAPISAVQDVLFKRERDRIDWQALKDLAPYRIGYSAGYAYAPEFLAALSDGSLRGDPVSTQRPELVHLRKLQAGRIDLAVCERSVCDYLLAHEASLQGGEPLVAIERSVGPVRTFHLGLSRAYPGAEALLRAFDAELQRYDREGLRQAVFQRYGMQVRLPR